MRWCIKFILNNIPPPIQYIKNSRYKMFISIRLKIKWFTVFPIMVVVQGRALGEEEIMREIREVVLTTGHLDPVITMVGEGQIYPSQKILENIDNMVQEIQEVEGEAFQVADQEETIMALEAHKQIEIIEEGALRLEVVTKGVMDPMVLEEATFHGHRHLALLIEEGLVDRQVEAGQLDARQEEVVQPAVLQAGMDPQVEEQLY